MSIRSRLTRLVRGLRDDRFWLDENCWVEELDIYHLRYHENGKSVRITQENIGNVRAFQIYRDSIRNWEAPHLADVIDEVERDRIVEQVRKALGSRGYRLMVSGSGPQ